MINPEFLVDGVLRGVLGGRKKKSKKALKYLRGRGGGGGWMSNPNTLLTAAGLIWGVVETLQQQGGKGATGAIGATGASGASEGARGATVPPLPLPLPDAVPGVPTDALRIVRLAISAANADGSMNEAERAAIVEQAAASGASDLVAAELAQRRPLAEIAAGVADPAQRATLYVLAYTVLRADEQISGSERIYLAQLANLLGLSPQDVQRLEQDAAERIDKEG